MSTKTKKQIHRHMPIREILSLFPQQASRLSQEITNAGLACMGCSAATWETLEVGMMGHGKTEAEIDQLVARLNALLEEQNEADPTTITLTPRAAAKYREILKEENKEGWGVRLSEEAAGCNGYEHVLDYSEKATPQDVVFTSEGIEIHVHKAIASHLIGSTIDFVDGLQYSGFKVTNPNVRSSCGCGSSHGY